MQKRFLYALSLALLLGSTSGIVTPAHAGVYEFINELFTFREDQKDRVTPNRTLPPRIVQTPNFDTRAQQQWNGYYTQDNLAPRDYLNGSASKVIRVVNDIPPSQRQVARPQAQQHGQGQARIATLPTQPNQNFIPRNQLPRVQVGPAGQQPNQQSQVGAPRGVAQAPTKVGNPVRSWQDSPAADAFTPRKGDFDYQNRGQDSQPRPQARIEIAPTPRAAPQQLVSLADTTGRRIYNPNGNGNRTGNTTRVQSDNQQRYPSRYIVENGDTLTTIADKPQIYDDWTLWPLIWDANRGTIKNPEVIYPKQNLGIPRDYSQSQATDARHRARNR